MSDLDYQKAIRCLQKEPHLRKPDELAKVQQALLPLAFFSKMVREKNQNQLPMCIRVMKWKQYKKGECVFHKGERSNNYYIILTGEVQILTSKDSDILQDQIDQNSDTKQKNQALVQWVLEYKMRIKGFNNMSYEQKLSRLYDCNSPLQSQRQTKRDSINRVSIQRDFIFQNLNEREFNIPINELNKKIMFSELDVPEMYFKEGVFAFEIVNTLTQGQAFGEGGLILHQGRSATVICSQDCDFAVLDKEDYVLILKDLQQEKMLIKTQLLCQSLNYRLDVEQVAPIMNCFQKVKIKINNFLFREGQISKNIYLIKKGEVLCLKNSKGQNAQKSNKLQKVDQKIFQIPLAIVRQGTMLGYNRANFSAQVVSSFTSLYSASRAQFEQVMNEYPHLISAFEDSGEEFDKNLFFKSLNDQATPQDTDCQSPIRIDIIDIKQALEKSRKHYGNQITEICQNRQDLNKILPQPKSMTYDQMLLQFDSKALDKAERMQRQRVLFVKRLKLLDPTVQISPVKELTIEQKIRIKKQIKTHNPRIFHLPHKKSLDLASLLSDMKKREKKISCEPDAISINNIQKFLDGSIKPLTQQSIQLGGNQNNYQAQFKQQLLNYRATTTQASSRPLGHFRMNSQHNLFRAKSRQEVEFNILQKRKFSII